MKEIHHLRTEYNKFTLDEAHLPAHPMQLFERWWQEVEVAQLEERNAMALSTVDEHEFPQSRIMLLKDFSMEGFTFFTNYLSDKGRQIAANPKAALLFFWSPLERQVRVSGMLEKLPSKESEAYFRSRPLGSQIGALASAQSQRVPDRATIDQRYDQLMAQYKDHPETIPYPTHWGGFLLRPRHLEFWQGRPSRLHDRIAYTLDEMGEKWSSARLSP